MASYRCRAASLRTGAVVAELPLTNVSATVGLEAGKFTAKLVLPTVLPDHPDRALQLARCRDLLNATTPGTMTVLLQRDGQLLPGEWLIWSRDLSQTPVQIEGLQVESWFSRVVVDGFAMRTNVDQLRLARDLAQHALNKPLSPLMTVEDPGLSGNIVPKAEYPTGTEYVGSILNELGADLNGFDWWVDTAFDSTSLTPKVTRTVRFKNPRRGRLLQSRIDVPADRPGQSGVNFGFTEDASRVITTVYMTGTGEGDRQLVARGLNPDLLVGYPPLDFIDSRANYDVQSLLDAQAAAVAAANRSPQLPTSVPVRADGDLALGSYAPGDVVPIVVEPCATFPDGYNDTVRITGFTIAPPSDGSTEIVSVDIQNGDTSVFTATGA